VRVKLFALSLLMLIALLAEAHEFWLQPDKFIYNVGEELKINFKVGEDFIGEPWKANSSRIERLELHQLEKTTDLKSSFKEDSTKNLSVILKEEGTHLIVMQSNHAFIELEAEKFNAYLKEDGLDEVLQYRQAHNLMDKPGKETYTRYAKLMVQVGNTKDATFKKSANLPIEIFIEKNPYNIKAGDLVRFKVMFQNKPLFGVRVMIWNRINNRTTKQPVYTMKDGTIEARISNKGSWMVSVVKMIPSRDKTADWESYWGSLVFGIDN
jgi:uncharacterized GH25 family protein